MSTPANPVSGVPPAAEVLIPASNDVQLDGVEQKLVEYAVHLAYLHWLLFAAPLIVLSGRDREHALASEHYSGRAIDLRTHELEIDELLVFLTLVAFSAPARQVSFATGRKYTGESFIHLELMQP